MLWILVLKVWLDLKRWVEERTFTMESLGYLYLCEVRKEGLFPLKYMNVFVYFLPSDRTYLAYKWVDGKGCKAVLFQGGNVKEFIGLDKEWDETDEFEPIEIHASGNSHFELSWLMLANYVRYNDDYKMVFPSYIKRVKFGDEVVYGEDADDKWSVSLITV